MDNTEDRKDSETAGAKRPYERPRIVETAEFETLALACAKTVSNPTPQCQFFGTSNS